MAYLTTAEVSSHLYNEVVAEIERNETTKPLLQQAIDAAIAEVKSYLSAYDIAAIFEAIDGNRNAILLLYTKDVAVWHFIQLANPAVECNFGWSVMKKPLSGSIKYSGAKWYQSYLYLQLQPMEATPKIL
jgi:hypothetical protein